jgi:hypothetical protein
MPTYSFNTQVRWQAYLPFIYLPSLWLSPGWDLQVQLFSKVTDSQRIWCCPQGIFSKVVKHVEAATIVKVEGGFWHLMGGDQGHC